MLYLLRLNLNYNTNIFIYYLFAREFCELVDNSHKSFYEFISEIIFLN